MEESLIRSLENTEGRPAILVVSHRSAFSGTADATYVVEGRKVARVDPDPRTARTRPV